MFKVEGAKFQATRFLGVGLVWEEAGHRGWGRSRGARGGRGIGPFELVVCVAALNEMG